MSRVLALLVATALITSIMSATLPGSASAATWRPQQGAKFNVPRAKPGNQFRLERQVLGAINHSRSGSVIRMAMFSYDRFPITDALIRARKRGVRVQVLVNNHEGSGAQNKLARKIGRNPSKKNFIYQCKRGCRSRGNNLHAKFYLFTKTGAAKNVVMTGSINMKLNGHKNQYNDLSTVNGAAKVHDQFVAIFNQMRKDKPVASPYINKAITPNIRLQMMPWRGPWRADPINYHLKRVRCRATDLNGGRTFIRVNMHAWDGDRGVRIAKAVRRLYAEGCKVRVQYGYGGKLVRQVFGNPTKRGYVPVRSSGLDTNGDGQIDLYTHTKIMLINGNYDGARNRRVVLTGSSNYQNWGTYGDEEIIRFYGKARFRQYLNHYNWMWNKRTRKVYYSRVATARSAYLTPGARSVPASPVGREAIKPTVTGQLPKMELVEPYGIDSKEWRDE